MVLPNLDRIRTLGEKEAYKYLGILEADTIKQMGMTDKIKKKYLRRTRKLLETKLSNRTLKIVDKVEVLILLSTFFHSDSVVSSTCWQQNQNERKWKGG